MINPNPTELIFSNEIDTRETLKNYMKVFLI